MILIFSADCFPGVNIVEFLCENHRYIPFFSFFLQCDGFDHCGDGNDENDENEQRGTHEGGHFFPEFNSH